MTSLRDQVLDALLEGDDIELGGADNKIAARLMLEQVIDAVKASDLDHSKLMRVALPVARRVMSGQDWILWASAPDLVKFCESRLDDINDEDTRLQTGIDEQANSMQRICEEYIVTRFIRQKLSV